MLESNNINWSMLHVIKLQLIKLRTLYNISMLRVLDLLAMNPHQQRQS